MICVGLAELRPNIIPMPSFVVHEKLPEVDLIKEGSVIESPSYDRIDPVFVHILVAEESKSLRQILSVQFTLIGQSSEDLESTLLIEIWRLRIFFISVCFGNSLSFSLELCLDVSLSLLDLLIF